MANRSASVNDVPNRKTTSMSKAIYWGVAALVFAALTFVGVKLTRDAGSEPAPPVSGAPVSDAISRGEYLARAADCVACHTSEFSKPFAGGRAFSTPFGTLYSTNITADQQHGIGSWSDEEFLKAVREGVARKGNLYPAMPYTSYAAMSRADVLAIKSYLHSLPPVNQANQVNGIGFPFNQRWSLKFWNLIFFNERRYQVDAAKSPEWNRGAYLTNALGHCGECHTPRNLGFAVSESRSFSGTQIEGWLAPNLTSDQASGLGGWTDQQLLSYLKTGHAPGRSSASGPMAEVIQHSLQYLTNPDLRSMVVYLRSLPSRAGAAPNVALLPKSVTDSNSSLPASNAMTSDVGLKLFSGDCAGCHMWTGRGRQSRYADLAGTRSVNDPAGSSVVQAILDGTEITVGGERSEMPGFRAKYSDAEVAALANYVLKHFGNKEGRVTRDSVASQRNP